MNTDYFQLIGITFFVGMLFFVGSFVGYVWIENMIRALWPTDTADPLYNMSHGSAMVYPTDAIEQLRNIYKNMQLLGVIAQVGYFAVSAYVVSRVRFTPLGIPFFLVLYFIGIFTAMLYANLYSNVSTMIQTGVPSFTVNSYFEWINLNQPYITAAIGLVMFIFAYLKSPQPQTQTAGITL